MAYTYVNVFNIKNICKQIVIINVKEKKFSPIFTKSGGIQIASGASLVVEDDRISIKQLNQMANNKTIKFDRTKQRVEIIEPSTGSSGSSGA